MFEIESAVKSTFTEMYSFTFSGRSISNLDDILDASKYIYFDKHVLYKSRRNAQKRAILNPTARIDLDVLLHDLSQKVWNYFNLKPNTPNTQADFDWFHDELCIMFESRLTAIRVSSGLSPAKYGNAQKMINILFKYLSCFDDYHCFADLFSYCHIPIDNYILRNIFLPLGVRAVKTVPYDMEFNGQGWYNLDREHYLSLLSEYRSTLAPIMPIGLPYLAIDFYWWRGMSVSLPLGGTLATPIAQFCM